MQIADALDFVRRHHRAVIATTRSDGRPAMTPVLATVDGDDRVVVSTREPSMKVRNLRRDPRAALCVMNDGFFGDWVHLEGDVEILELPDAMEPLVDYYRRTAGEHDDWEGYRAAMQAEQRVLVRMRVDRVGPSTGG